MALTQVPIELSSTPGIVDNSNATAITIDSSEQVGIGTSNAATSLHVNSGANGEILRIQGADAQLRIDNSTSNVMNINSSGSGDSLTLSTGGTEAMRIDSSGNLLVGKTSADNTTAGTTIYGPVAKGAASFVRDAGNTLVLNRLTSDGEILAFRKDGSTVGSIGTAVNFLTIGTGDSGLLFNSSDDAVQPWNITTNAARDASIDLGRSSHRFKDLYLSGGAYLGGTGSANYLDDYEEGSFTFTLRDATSGGNVSSSTQTASYTKIGRMVRIELSGAVSNIDTTGMTGANNLYFDLPFVKSGTEGLGPVSLSSFTFPSGYSEFMAEALSGSVGIIRMAGDNIGARAVRVNEVTSGATDITRLSLTYFT